MSTVNNASIFTDACYMLVVVVTIVTAFSLVPIRTYVSFSMQNFCIGITYKYKNIRMFVLL